MKTLLLIDVQNDFMPSGALPVAGGDEILPVICRLLPEYDCVIASQDWHPAHHQSFAAHHAGKKPFDVIELHGLAQVLWPVHCVQGSVGAALHSALPLEKMTHIVQKGSHAEVDSYSAFYDNGRRYATDLLDYLHQRQITAIDVAGLAADYCVYYSIIDALQAGLQVRLIEAATRPIDAAQWAEKRRFLLSQPNFSIL